MDDFHDAIEAFIDGEYVDPLALKQALAEEAGRDLLIDLLALRGMVAAQPEVRSAAADAPARSRAARLRLVAAAAGIAALSIFGGYRAGQRHTPTLERPSVITPAPAPAPTHVIRLENGVDWNEKVGG